MNNTFVTKIYSPVSVLLILSTLVWALGLPTLIKNVAAVATLTAVEDTIEDSDLSTAASHTIVFRTQTAMTQNATGSVVIALPAFQSTSSPAFAVTDATDFRIATSSDGTTGWTSLTVRASSSCPATGLTQFEISSTTNSSGATQFQFKHCYGTGPVAAGTYLRFQIGNAAGGGSKLVNPAGASSYMGTIDLDVDSEDSSADGTADDSATFRVAVLGDVDVTALVQASLTFTVAASSTAVASPNDSSNTTDVATTATSIPWGTLTAGTAKQAAHRITVATNATNGYYVYATTTVMQNSAGNDIDVFQDASASAGAAWASPAATLGDENTYGHWGITSDDDDVGLTDGQYLGAPVGTPQIGLTVARHTGASDGTTADQGSHQIGYQIQVSALQESGDYSNSITYIVAPKY